MHINYYFDCLKYVKENEGYNDTPFVFTVKVNKVKGGQP